MDWAAMDPREPTPQEREELEELFRLEPAELLRLIGRACPMDLPGPPRPPDQYERLCGIHWLQRRRQVLHDRVCVQPDTCARAAVLRRARPRALATGILDQVADLCDPAVAFPLAVLIAKWGLEEFCQCDGTGRAPQRPDLHRLLW